MQPNGSLGAAVFLVWEDAVLGNCLAPEGSDDLGGPSDFSGTGLAIGGIAPSLNGEDDHHAIAWLDVKEDAVVAYTHTV